MDITLILSRFIGIYLTIVGVAVVLNRGHFEEALAELSNSKFHQILAGIIPLFIGAMMVSVHNKWEGGLTCVVSTMAWLFVFAGFFRLTFTPTWLNLVARFKGKDVVPFGIIAVILGVVFLYLSITVSFQP